MIDGTAGSEVVAGEDVSAGMLLHCAVTSTAQVISTPATVRVNVRLIFSPFINARLLH